MQFNDLAGLRGRATSLSTLPGDARVGAILFVRKLRGKWWLCVVLISAGLFSSQSAGSTDVSSSGEGKLMYEEPKHLTGSIYAKGPEPRKLLFNFKRVATRSGSTLDVVRKFSYPDGAVAAQEHIVYEANQLVLFELNDLQSGAKGT